MAIRRKTTAKLASISALGVGALGVGAGEAYASVVYSGPIGGHVGFQTSSHSHLTFKLGLSGIYGTGPGQGLSANFQSHQFKFSTARIGSVSGGARGVFFSNDSKLKFGTTATNGNHPFFGSSHQNYFIFLKSAGGVWSSTAFQANRGLVASRSWLNTEGGAKHRNTWGTGPFTDEYVLFEFLTGPNTYYGWIDLSLSINKANQGVPTNPADGPNLTINSFAYNTTPNEFLPAGTTELTPEPATFELTGLAALVLGAAGVRRWRKAKLPQS